MYVWKEVEGTPLQTIVFYGLVAQETRETAEKVLARLELLYQQYPSPELGEAVRKVRDWRDTLQTPTRQDDRSESAGHFPPKSGNRH